MDQLDIPKETEFCVQRVPYFWQQKTMVKYYPMSFKQSINGKKIDLADGEWENICELWDEFKTSVSFPKPTIQFGAMRLLKFSASERITCMDVNSEILAFGTSEGLIYFCQTHDLTRPFYVADHGQCVTSVRFWQHFPHDHYESYDFDYDLSYDYRSFAISKCIDSRVKFWDFGERRELKSGGHLADFIMSSPVNSDECYSAWGCFISKYKSRSRSVYCLWEYEFREASNETVVAMYRDWAILTLNSETNKTRLHSPRIRNYESRGIIPEPIREREGRYRILPKDFLSSTLKKFYFLSLHMSIEVTACITDNRLALSIHDAPWTSYNMNKRIGGNVRCLCVHNNEQPNHLIMGLDTGVVCVMTAIHPVEWLRFSMDNYNIMKLEVATEPIIFLECNADTIIAATANNIYVNKYDFKIKS